MRGPGVFAEYWQRPDETRAAFRDGWFRTGDMAVIERGAYRLLGRTAVDIIKTGGFKVSALEIEEVLRTHPAIAECAVVGLADPGMGRARRRGGGAWHRRRVVACGAAAVGEGAPGALQGAARPARGEGAAAQRDGEGREAGSRGAVPVRLKADTTNGPYVPRWRQYVVSGFSRTVISASSRTGPR